MKIKRYNENINKNKITISLECVSEGTTNSEINFGLLMTAKIKIKKSNTRRSPIDLSKSK